MKIVLTGGGTAGHVTPNLALIEALKPQGWQIDYIGSANSVEQTIIAQTAIPFHTIATGKLRRYFSWQNFFDPVRILYGIWQAFWLLRRLQTEVVFSKGGFVAFPVVVGAWFNRIPVIAHESDMTPGLANRLSFPFVNKICVNFAAAKEHFKQQDKVEVTGTPIRKQLFEGNHERGLARCGFSKNKPCLLVIGGSQGAQTINQHIRNALPLLLADYQVIHLCGKGKIEPALHGQTGYYQLEYADEELPDLFAASSLVISRAGANALCEILALQKPHILIPLSAKTSRGDQLHNARYFRQLGISTVIFEEELTQGQLLAAIKEVEQRQVEIIKNIQALKVESAVVRIVAIIKEQLHVESPETV